MSRGFSGAGIGVRRAHVDALVAAGDGRPPVVELTPSHYFADPGRVEAIAAGRAVVLHDVFASLATAGPLDAAHLDRVAEVARRSRAIAYTEHLALTRSPCGIDLGHLIPVPRTPAQLAVLVDHVRAVQDRLGLAVALELPTTTLVHPATADAMPEGEFVAALVEASGCELVLDLENLRVDADNYRGQAWAEPEARLASLPLAAVSHVQLAGGHTDADGWVVDSHAAPVPPATWALLARLRGRIAPRTIVVERDAALPSLAELLAEAERAAAIWAGAEPAAIAPAPEPAG